MSGETILIADDDAHIRDIVCFALKREGFSVCIAEDGQQVVEQMAVCSPDLLILDILMPVLDGMEACRRLRAESDVPVIFLTSKDDEIDRIVGLELGADDYIAKPFSPREMVARVKAVLRRLGRGAGGSDMLNGEELVCNGLLMNRISFTVTFRSQSVPLTAKEFALLEILMRSPARVFSREQLMDHGSGAYIADRTIDSHIRKIRHKFKKVGCDPVETVRGIGYRLGRWE